MSSPGTSWDTRGTARLAFVFAMTAPSRFSPGPLSRRDLAVITAVTVVEVVELRTGGPSGPRSAAMGAVGLLLSLAQGLPLLWVRRWPVAVLAVVSAAFVLHAVLLVPVPPYGAWVALAVLAARREMRAAYLL